QDLREPAHALVPDHAGTPGGGIGLDLVHARQRAERALDQPYATGTAHAFDQQHHFATMVAEITHDMARDLLALPCLFGIRAIAAWLRLLCRMRAQAVVVAESKLLDPRRRRMATLATQGAPAAGDLGMHDAAGRQFLAAVPATGVNLLH